MFISARLTSVIVTRCMQAGGPRAAGPHASHVVLRRLPLDPGQRAARPLLPGAHPHHCAPLSLLRRHLDHHDDELHRHQAGDPEHPGVGQ